MESNYKKLGGYIRQIDKRNSDASLGEDNLFGISVTKEFIVSHANLVGVSFNGYKVVAPHQFAYIPDTSRRGDKIAISLNTFSEDIIVSSICSVFEVIDESQLLPEYLMLWFMRPEFDRYARFMSNGSAREVFDWDCMCGVELPVPPIEEQRKIVYDYQAITDRIELLRKMNENLEEQASVYFENTFGRFIPDGMNTTDNIPVGWNNATVGDYCKASSVTFSGKDRLLLYLDTGSITSNYVGGLQTLDTTIDEIPSRARRKVSNGDIVYSTVRPNLRHYGIIYNPPANMIVSTGFAVMSMLKGSPVSSEFIYMWLTRTSVVTALHSIAENSVSTYPSIVSADLENVKIVVPTDKDCEKCSAYLKSVFHTINYNNKEINTLERLSSLFSNQVSKGA